MMLESWKVISGRERDWRPRSLRPGFLIGIIIVSLALIASLQYLLVRSQRDNGIIFADDINALPLSRSFPYLYMPTIIAVIYGFAWTWIDLDVRRIEPFYQLARDEGARAEESVLLSYPVDFVASVPLKALRFRHWSPFVASFATVFVFWGLTPSQAGIFATSIVNQTDVVPMAYSTSHLTLEQQIGSLSAKSANSVSSILWLNETLQPYMRREAMLAPFGPVSEAVSPLRGTWTAQTWQYFANVSCEKAAVWKWDNSYWLNSSWGCSYSAPTLRSPAILDKADERKIFDTNHVGYYNIDGNANYYLGNSGCPKTQSNSFMVQWSKALVSPSIFGKMSPTEQRENASVNSLYCRSFYFAQKVQATIQLPTRSVLHVEPLESPQQLPPQVFNSSAFEASMSEGRDRFKTDFPSPDWPDQTSYLRSSELFLGFLSRMAPFAIGSTKLPMEEYLVPENLEKAYRGAYGLLFARQMAEVLLSDLDAVTTSNGTVRFETQSVIVVPTFVYIVEALLGSACLFASLILYFSRSRRTKLVSDPASLAALMSLSADDPKLLQLLSDLDTTSCEELEETLRNYSFQLCDRNEANGHYKLILRPSSESGLGSYPTTSCKKVDARDPALRVFQNHVPGVQPLELSLKVGVAFFCGLLTAFVVLGVLFILVERSNGLPLPSQDRFVRQLLENYIPTGVATLIEPFWLLLNRNLCYLQPFETLRKHAEPSARTIELDYLSLPPQLVAFKAALRRHFLLGTICMMTLLANLLSVALSGLFSETTTVQSLTTNFTQSSSMRFSSVNGNDLPVAVTTGDPVEAFYIATSNLTADTPLPKWSDSSFLYQPFSMTGQVNLSTGTQKANTAVFGADLDCQPLSTSSSLIVTGTAFDDTGVANIPSTSNLTVRLMQNGQPVSCVPRNKRENGRAVDPTIITGKPTGQCAYEFSYALRGINGSSSDEDKFCQEHLAAGWIRAQLQNGTKLPGTEHVSTTPTIVESYTPFVMVCRGQILTGRAEVTVETDGHVLRADSIVTEQAPSNLFLSTPSDILGQAHQSILKSGLRWHNDSNPSDFGNYLIAQATNSSVMLDPKAEVPTLEAASAAFTRMYSTLFAIWLQRNQGLLFESSGESTITGVQLVSETRIVMSYTMFVLSECILALYMVVTVIVYVNRPWKVLCRLPTTIASTLAYLAASRAILDMRDTVAVGRRELSQHLKGLGHTYGFGSFIGRDGLAHVGIERGPYVASLVKGRCFYPPYGELHENAPEAQARGLRQRLRDLRPGKAREGGWI